MAAEVNTGMAKQEMKLLLARSKKEPVNCSIGQGDDATIALLLLDKVKGPKAVETELKKQIPAAKATRFGTASVDMELDPKEVRISVNKPAPGFARKLVKTLKGTGFTKVVIVSDEDGSVLEKAGEEETQEATQAPAAPEAQAAPQPPAAPPPPPPPPGPPPLDAAALARALAELIKRIPTVVAAAPTVKTQLAQLANDANGKLKAPDLPGAAAAIIALRRALDGAQPAAANTAAAPAPAPAGKPPEGAKVSYAKSRLAWLAARKKVESDIEKLRAELVASFEDEGEGPELDKLYRARVAPVLEQLDESLADKLDEAMNAADPEKHRQLVNEAKTIIKTYSNYVESEALLADLDDNPFVPVAIKSTLTATLSALSKTIV